MWVKQIGKFDLTVALLFMYVFCVHLLFIYASNRIE